MMNNVSNVSKEPGPVHPERCRRVRMTWAGEVFFRAHEGRGRGR